MIEFKNIELSDKTWIDKFIRQADSRGCHLNFTNLFAWSGTYHYRAAQIKDYLLIKGNQTCGGLYYFYPLGNGDVKPIIEILIEDAKTEGSSLVLAGISKDNMLELQESFPDRFTYSYDRDSYDYLYNLDKMVSLSVKKLQSKRNHINRFKENSDWGFELINSTNIDECWLMNKEWCRLHDCKDDIDLAHEACAVKACFKHYIELGLEGGLLRLNGKIIAFTMADRLNSDTYDIHIEKAFGEIQGAYQMINREFAAHLQATYADIIYVNREEDVGFEGLRKAKLSYQPAFFEEKIWAKHI